MTAPSRHGTNRLKADPLSAVLQDVRLVAAHHCQCEVRAPWGLRLPRRSEAMVHFILEGSCWLEVPGQPPLQLRTGDVVMLPHGAGHRLLSEPGIAARPVEAYSPVQLGDSSFRLIGGKAGPKTRLVCCGVAFDEPTIHPLIALMPQMLLMRDEVATTPPVRALLEAMGAEMRDQRLGAATVMTRLADIVVTQVVRTWVEERTDRAQAWAAAIRDPQVGRALAAFHAEPARRWSVASLAAAANLSRSVFAERFTATVGISPANYVARWRIHVAGVWLRGQQLSIAQVSARLGFTSEASFSRTFTRLMGSSPAAFRRTSPPDVSIQSFDAPQPVPTRPRLRAGVSKPARRRRGA
jgi:AraC-like DNA-binding protein